jgi:predicted TIM-barrel fold metal-dependent hydrolase
MKYDIISGDSHIDMTWMPGTLFVEIAPPKFKKDVPQIVQQPDGPHWFAEGKDLGVYGGLGFGFTKPERGHSKHVDKMYEYGFYEGAPHPTTPELRLKDMSVDGIDAEVIYGILGVGMRFQNKEMTQAVYEIYNSWAADFCKKEPGRWAALACIPNHDPKIAALELRRAAKLGLKGADFAVATAVKPVWHRDWDVLWEAAAETGLPISFHTTGPNIREPNDAAMAKEYDEAFRMVKISLFQVCGSEYLASVIFGGVCERYPDFKFVLGECGITWLPHVLNRMDEEFEDRRAQNKGLSMTPSEYWARQGYSTYQHEVGLKEFVPMVGEDRVIWGSDYPHPDGIWPDSRKWIEEDLAEVEEEARRKITRDNAGKLYGFLK